MLATPSRAQSAYVSTAIHGTCMSCVVVLGEKKTCGRAGTAAVGKARIGPHHVVVVCVVSFECRGLGCSFLHAPLGTKFGIVLDFMMTPPKIG